MILDPQKQKAQISLPFPREEAPPEIYKAISQSLEKDGHRLLEGTHVRSLPEEGMWGAVVVLSCGALVTMAFKATRPAPAGW